MTKSSTFSFKKQILYPACLMFFVLIMGLYLIAGGMGMNVTESSMIENYKYVGSNGGSSVSGTENAPNDGLGLPTMLGLLFFSFTFMFMNGVLATGASPISKRLIHLLGTLFAFLLFFVVMSGIINEENALILLGISIMYVMAYYILLALKKLFDRHLRPKIPTRVRFFLQKYTLPIFCGFTAITFLTASIGIAFSLKATARFLVEKTFVFDDVIEQESVIIVTPLAPTIQNYLRYLASSVAYFSALYILFTKLNVVAKVLINFAILATSFTLIWLFGSEYFRYVKPHAFIAVVTFVIAYLAALIGGGIYVFVKKRKLETSGEYVSQFGVSRKKK